MSMKFILILTTALILLAAGGTGASAQNFTEQQILNFAYAYETRLAYDDDGNVEYIGKAAPGTATSAAGWQIQKITYASGDASTVKFADGTAACSKVWDSRATYTYEAGVSRHEKTFTFDYPAVPVPFRRGLL
jgi:hypothetical protein